MTTGRATTQGLPVFTLPWLRLLRWTAVAGQTVGVVQTCTIYAP